MEEKQCLCRVVSSSTLARTRHETHVMPAPSSLLSWRAIGRATHIETASANGSARNIHRRLKQGGYEILTVVGLQTL